MSDNKLFDRDFWDGVGVEEVKSTLDSGADIAATDDYGRTALHLAVERQDYSATVLLLGHGASANAQGHWGDTPLHWAVVKRNSAITSLLLNNHADVNARDHSGRSPLFYAVDVSWGVENIDIINILLQNGSDVNARDDAGATPLLHAVERDRPDFCEVLLQHGADPGVRDAKHRTLLHYASFAYFVSDEALEDHYPLSKKAVEDVANESGALSDCEDSEGRTPLDYCVAVRNSHLVRWMLERDIGSDLYRALGLGTGGSFRSSGLTPLHYIFLADWHLGDDAASVVEQLLNHGAAVNAQDIHGRTPLHYAMAFGRTTDEGIQQLLECQHQCH